MKKTAMVLSAALFMLSASVNAGEYLVKYKNTNALNRMASMQTEVFGMQVTGMHKPGQLVKVSIQKNTEAKAIAALLADKNIQYVVPNARVKAFTAPVEISALKEQYAIARVNAEAAWKRAGNKGSRNVVIAVIDTGVDYKHPNLAPNMIAGYDFIQNDNDPMDITKAGKNPGHGTHCAGIAGATGLVEGGITGLSPEVSIMPVRALSEDGGGTLDGLIKAVDYAIEKKVAVISASWGMEASEAQAKPIIEAVQRADKAGIIFVAAAGNSSKNNDKAGFFPTNTNSPNMISVAASSGDDSQASFTNYGKAMVSLSAPGVYIMSTVPSNKYQLLSGTSMATPLVSGLVAFLKAQDMSLTGAEIKALLQTTGAKVNIETACNCRVDAFAATDALLSKTAWLVPAAATLAKDATVQLTMKNGTGAVRFESSNPAILQVNSTGLVTALAEGSATIKATDAAGVMAQSLDINVGKGSGSSPGQPGEPGECPLGDPQLCEAICQIMPDAPWCHK